MTTAAPTKSYELKKWSLDDLYPSHDGPEMAAALEALDLRVAEMEARRELLTPDISNEAFKAFIIDLEEGYRTGVRAYYYANLWYTEDTQNQQAQTFVAKMQQTFAMLQNRIMFFELWWKELDSENADRLMDGAADYRYYLQAMRNFQPYTRSEAEEKVINIKNLTGNNALTTLFSTITNRYVFKMEVDGEEKELTRGQLSTFVVNPDPDVRAAAYQEMFRVYSKDAPILGQIYQNLVRDWKNENIDLRGFKSPMSVRNLYNDIPDEVVDTLLDVAKKNVDIFQRFFNLKARWLDMDKLRRYDLYAPPGAISDKEYDFNDAIGLVLESFAEFDPNVADMARQIFEEDRIDSEVRKGKADGAFCAPVDPQLTPWVQVNYQGRARDIATLAHELGHAIHGLLASDHNLFTYNSSLPLAETASTFAEMLVVDRLLAQETDETVRTEILFRQIDDAYGTIMRQVYFALFEREAHKLVDEGASVDQLSEAYLENMQEQFGDAIDISDEFKWEWVGIPHIYNVPFYVYAYAFGQLLVFSLYQQYKAEGEAFKPRYLKILAAGGSAAPVEILADAGIDVTSAEFWQGGFDVISRLVEELEAMPVK